jgi:hypothetical protein
MSQTNCPITQQEFMELLDKYDGGEPQTEPVISLSKTPSVAIRQAVNDVRAAVAAGAAIDLDAWGSLSPGLCRGCLAGAVLLRRQHYRRMLTGAMRNDPTALERITSQLYPGDAPSVSLTTGGLIWKVDLAANSIANSFNRLRYGKVRDFLRNWCGLPGHIVDHLAEYAPPVTPRAGILTSACVADMCRELEQLATYLQSRGY